MLTKEEKLKKLKIKIKRTKVTVTSWYNSMDMTSKIKDLNIDIVTVDGMHFFDITVNQVEVMHKLCNVNHHFLYRPSFGCAEIRDCKYIPDGYYECDYLMSVNSYDMWNTHFIRG